MEAGNKPISVSIAEPTVAAGQDLKGEILLNYSGRFDSLVINSQIEDSNDVFSYTSLNGKKINHPYARLSIFKAELGAKNPVQFTAQTKHVPAGESSNAKFRVSIIQEHKEVASDVARVRIVRA